MAAFVALVLSGCGLIKPLATPVPTINVTQALETVQAWVTKAVEQTPTPAASPSSTSNPAAAGTPTPWIKTPATSQTALVTVEPGADCDRAAPGSPIDVTIEDDTPMQPGQKFTKIWRLVNTGSCTWTRDYHAVWFSGEKFGENLSVSLGKTAPGASVEVAVDMVAPDDPGTYQSYWKMSNPAGILFGIGPNGLSPFWVQIVVVESVTSTTTPTMPATLTPTPTSSPTPTPSPTPFVVTSGDIIVQAGVYLDLDAKEINPGGGSDLAYQADANNHHWLAPQGKAVLGVYGMTEPGLQVCQTATMSAAPVAVESLTPGAYLCYKTNQNALGWLRYDSYNTADSSITIYILTWGLP